MAVLIGNNLIQGLMDQAYDKWQSTEGMNYDQFVDSLDDIEKAAVVAGNLNYQVCNGGFAQWVENGYISKVDELLDLLQEIDTALSNTVTDLVSKARSAWNDYEQDDEWSWFFEATDQLDGIFYNINDEWLSEVEVFLREWIEAENFLQVEAACN